MKKKTRIITIILLVLIVLALVVVFLKRKTTDERKYEVTEAELAPIKEQFTVSIKRYEEDIFAIPIDSLSVGIQKLYGQYPEELIEKDVWHNQEMVKMLREYLEDSVIRDIYMETIKTFPNLDEIATQLKDALTYYQYYYPKATIPHFYTLVSGIDIYSPTVFLINQNILIHLDMYLGADCKWYAKIPNIPKYISERFDKKYLPIDCFKKALVYKHLPDKKNITLLDYLIEEGKKLYFTELMFPNTPEQDIIGYSEEKFQWAETYQYDVWNYMINHNELFSKSDKVITLYINESPFTKVFQGSPGRLGAFTGWKLIKSYMKNNPTITLDELMNNTDSKDILNRSRYKPARK